MHSVTTITGVNVSSVQARVSFDITGTLDEGPARRFVSHLNTGADVEVLFIPLDNCIGFRVAFQGSNTGPLPIPRSNALSAQLEHELPLLRRYYLSDTKSVNVTG